MKSIPSNQTLILASERGASGGFPARVAGRAVGESVPQRVTLFASRPDDTLVYLQADYSSADSSARLGPAIGTLSASRAVAVTGTPAPVWPSPLTGSPFGSNRGAELYASTQRMLAQTRVRQVDVHA